MGISKLNTNRKDSEFSDYLLGIQHYLLELARLCKALDDLAGDVSSEVHTESECGVRGLHQVSQLF